MDENRDFTYDVGEIGCALVHFAQIYASTEAHLNARYGSRVLARHRRRELDHLIGDDRLTYAKEAEQLDSRLRLIEEYAQEPWRRGIYTQEIYAEMLITYYRWVRSWFGNGLRVELDGLREQHSVALGEGHAMLDAILKQSVSLRMSPEEAKERFGGLIDYLRAGPSV